MSKQLLSTTTSSSGSTIGRGDYIIQPTHNSSTTSVSVTILSPGGSLTVKASDATSIERAVYAHIRAIRTLGRTSVNTAEIAKALSLSISQVERAVAGLKDKGVKVVA